MIRNYVYTLNVPYEIDLIDDGIVPIQKLIDLLLIVASSPISVLSYDDLICIHTLSNHGGHLEVKMKSQLHPEAMDAIEKLWIALEPSGSVEFT